MRKLIIPTLTMCIAVSVIFSACNKSGKVSSSRKTGAAYNIKDRPGSLQVSSKVKPTPGPGLVHIEGGTFVMGGSNIDDIGFDYAAPKRRVTVATFYMDETEVANIDWLEYLNWIKEVPKDPRWYYEALPDTLVWRSPLAYNEPYVNNYLRHPAYQDYPVVGVTWEQAVAYCDWRTNVVNENNLRNQGILNNWKDYAAAKNGPTGKGPNTKPGATAKKVSTAPFDLDLYLNGEYDDKGKAAVKVTSANAKPAAGAAKGKPATEQRFAKIEDGVFTPGRYRLPTEAEWEYAALSLLGTGGNDIVNSSKIYPWYGLGIRSAKKNTRGLIYANFKRGEGDNMGVAGYLNDGADITAPINAYMPNDFGLYNMAGNVSEWVLDTYRQLSFDKVEDFSPFRGNDFENIEYDTNGKIQTIGKTNVPKKVNATTGKKDPYDKQANKYGNATEPSPSTPDAIDATKMPVLTPTFNPDQRGALDPQNLDLYGKITLVNDRSKVFKGGSWNDRAYWLNPGTRRYLDQGEATSEIGFRCAMSSVGDPQINKKSTPQFIQPKSRVGFKAKK
jgi:sulfatase modifying factor 1